MMDNGNPRTNVELSALLNRVEHTQEFVPADREESSLPGPAPITLDVVRMDSVERREVDWLWYPYFAKGKVSNISGDPGIGKSLITLDMAAAITTGKGFPDESGGRTNAIPLGNVLLLNIEDDLPCTIGPRLDDAGADSSRVIVIRGKSNGDQVFLQDVKLLEEAVMKYRPDLLVIDPVQSYVGDIDMHRCNEVRPVLNALGVLADRYNMATVIVRHLCKGKSDKAMHRGLGSVDFTAFARSEVLVGKDPQDPDTRAMVQVKNSLGPEGQSLAYRTRGRAIEWIGKSNLTAQDLGAAEENQSSREEAVDFLEKILAGDLIPATDVLKEADDLGISRRTLARARKDLGIQSKREGGTGRGGGQWVWSLPIKDAKNA